MSPKKATYPDEPYAHGYSQWRGERLTVREIAMLGLMNAITDKPNWFEKIYHDDIVAKWHNESIGLSLISEEAWGWCLRELRDAAVRAVATGRTQSLNTACGCVKADGLVSSELHSELLDAVAPLLAVPDDVKDWHPGSDNQVLNLVHPSLFPLVYGTTRVLPSGRHVDLADIFASCGQGDDKPPPPKETPSEYHSTRFQWLPCEVEFVGPTGTNVRIGSYINNLHPVKHVPLYRALEKLIGLAIPLWNDVIVACQSPRNPPRIVTRTATWDTPLPEWAHWRNLPQDMTDPHYLETMSKARHFLELPNLGQDEDSNDDLTEEDEDDQEERNIVDGTLGEPLGTVLDRRMQRLVRSGTSHSLRWTLSSLLERKWKRMRKLMHPKPGHNPSYDEWMANVKATQYDIHLEESYRETGLQVIIKLASIELTPERPTYAGGSWHLEGMLNEHITATAIYYYDVENVTTSRIGFRQEADIADEDLEYEQEEHWPLAEIFGTESMRDEPAVQEIGSVTTPQGRFLAFPNTLQHRVGKFELENKTKPGHRRFVVFWLVDPHYRLCSTKNVPPQQHSWWAEEGLDKIDLSPLPQEVIDMVKDEVGEWPMGLEETKRLRLELMQERTRTTDQVVRNFEMYNLCEH